MKKRTYQRVKRCIDIAGSAFGLGLSLPLCAATAGLVRVQLGAPVFFVQERPGLNGRPFRMVKFRTMRNPRPDEDLVASDAARLTPLGQFLRATSIDELPTLWNVLRGDMSLVGPRPLLMAYLARYNPEQARRHEVKPGLTGWAAVHGRNAISWEDKFELDVWYVDNASLLVDLKIIAKTVATVLTQRGVSAEGVATAVEFRGAQGGTTTVAESTR